MTLITGMLIEGKMSTGVRSNITGPIRNNKSASTTNVYGRRNASLTIHIKTSRQFLFLEEMSMLLHPHNLASKEYPPGPSKASAVQKTTCSNKPNQLGSAEICV